MSASSSSRPAGSPSLPVPENRLIALQVLQGVLRHQRPLDDQIEQKARGLESRDRAFVRLVVATTLRRIGQIDLLLKGFLKRPLAQKLFTVRDVLRLGVTQLLFLETPAHAVVDTSVQMVKRQGLGPYAGMVNAVLRRVAIEGAARSAALDAERFNTPRWLWQVWEETFGEETARALGRAHLREAPLDITLKPGLDTAAWADRLNAVVLPTGTLRRASGGAIPDLEGFAEGAWWVQDAAAALPVGLLGPVAGLRVADLCAAPGGKTAQLAAAGAHVTALDRSARRLARVRENLDRLGLQAEALMDADAAQWQPETPFDAVLLDAPCSATGTLRRHPDVARLKTPADIASLVQTQSALLAASAGMVKPGGLVIYCTCSLHPAEGEERITAALAEGLPFERVPLTPADLPGLPQAITPQGDVRTLPCYWPEDGGLDGFFMARLRRV